MHTAEQHRRKQGAKLVSIIVVNYNGKAVVARCLDCLLAQNYPNFEIIAVDNNSTDGSRAMLERYAAKGVRVIRSATNSGGPGGRNLALPYAGGEILAFIDNDGYADRNWLSAAVGTLESDERIGAVASAVFFARRRTILNGCGGTINWQGYGGDLWFHAPYEFADIPREVLFPMACGAVVRADVFARMGQFDPLPLKWYEDVE